MNEQAWPLPALYLPVTSPSHVLPHEAIYQVTPSQGPSAEAKPQGCPIPDCQSPNCELNKVLFSLKHPTSGILL